ncbi:MAG: DUF452 family protein [Succinivibrio sp.]|nr:DUF452 family protein [Succinivibrio sp.]
MQQYFLKQSGTEELNLFFAGFAQDERPFMDLPFGCDCAIVYDYRSLSFDATLYQDYANIKLVAWSMGVMMAPVVLRSAGLELSGGTLAINGTLEGISERYGIAPELFSATERNLTVNSLDKFYRRLCPLGGAEQYLSHCPQRPVAELVDELAALQRYAKDPETAKLQQGFSYDLAVVGTQDRIVPPAAQKSSWARHHTPVLEGQYAHYAESLLSKVLCA